MRINWLDQLGVIGHNLSIPVNGMPMKISLRVDRPISYHQLLETGELHSRMTRLQKLLEPCQLCPRECGALRISGERGECGSGKDAEISSFGPHFGEEPPLVGRGGSGTIFFAFCSLRCVFCQNFEISRGMVKDTVTANELADIMIGLQQRGCENINLVTPTHYLPQIIEALLIAAGRGLKLPLVYNCSGYERTETLRLLDQIVDIYMPDFKYADEKMAQKYSQIGDYSRVAREAIKEMHRQVGDLALDKNGVAFQAPDPPPGDAGRGQRHGGADGIYCPGSFSP